jgi:outer membrane protein OmpA-like peptidoglycan-associated protein
MSINLARLNNFSVDFIDGSITPSYKTHLEITKGTMKGLSSDPSARADFKIEGTIDRSATINSAGQMNPLNAMHYAKVDFSLKDFKLKPVSPYASKYAGYKIAEGKLHLDLKYRVDNSTFTGDNKIFVDQLTLGDKVDSPDATKLPVALGVALLKGVDGRITLQVPVSGNVKDPQFDFGQTITSALTKTMANVSSSPFSTFTDIGGFKGEELRFIEFESGLPELSAHATKKLNALAKFLNERSALTLDIEGTADRHIDWGKMSDKQAKEEKPSKDGGVFRSFISKMSGKQAKKEKPSSQQKTAKVQQKDLAKDQAIDDNQLKKLAQMRANIVKDYLVQKGKVSAKRVQLKPVKITSTTNKEHGRVELYLSAQ